MKKTVSIYPLFLFFMLLNCSITKSFGQQPVSCSFRFYNTSHGLPSSEIIALAKDSKDFLWVGTSAGLSKYDGYFFHNYAYSNDKELIGYVNVIKADSANRLWIGSGTGLFCFVNNEIVKLSAASALPQGVNDILPDKDGAVWLATENGPAKFYLKDVDFTGKKKITIANCLLKQWQLQNEVIDKRRTVLISKAPDGTVYIAGQNTLYRLLDEKLEQIHATANSRDKISSLFPVNKSTVYFDAASTEINKIENGIASSYNPEKLFKPDSNALAGAWYVGTRGAFCFDAESGTTSASIKFSDSNIIWPRAILKDNDFFWLASSDGLIKAKPYIFSRYAVDKFPYYKDYYSVAALQSGKILLGANFGRLFEKKENTFTLIKDKPVPSAEIKAMYEDERGRLWIASGYQGLVLMRNNKTERYTIENGLHDNSLYQFIKTTNGKLYVLGDRGISEIVVASNETVSFRKYYRQPNISQYAKFFSGAEAPDGSIWMGGEEGIVYFKNDSLHHFLVNGKQLVINFLIKDGIGNVWMAASGEGILQCIFNKKNELEIVKQFTEADGLNTLHYLTLLADKENNIWAGSSKGITFLGQKGKNKDRVLNFDESDGFIKPGYSYIRLCQDSSRHIWAATTLGFTSFNPQQLLSAYAPPVVYITAVRQIKTNGPVNNFSQNNRFAYSNNSFSFSFTALDYANQEGMRYYYKLDGLDTNWVNGDALRSISYENLSPGKYTFHAKALNNKSKWSEKDAVYSFIIASPFWKTRWFIFLLLITVAALAFFLYKRRIDFIKKREAEKTALQQLKAAGYREQLEIEQIINHFAASMNSISNIDDLLWDVAKNCISKLKFEDCVIYLKDEHRNVLIQKAAWGPKTTEENKIINPIEIPLGKGIVGSVALTGKAEIITDTALDERYIVDDVRRFSEIAIPVIINGVVTGVIDSEHAQKNFYTDRHLQILQTIAALCAGKIETINAEKQTQEKEMEVLRLNKDFATSQLTALRMQMNPHFIFNALNSIQQYILQGNVTEANKYLSKFSKLQRDILNCSNQSFISLEKEIEILSAYLQLEQLRFGDNFTYCINMIDEIDPTEIKIPPMMLQPFVENAIWHGLMPKPSAGNLDIQFDLYTDDILLATIRDNGIGRNASAKLKKNNKGTESGHESKGMSIVEQRLQLLQQQYDKQFEVTVLDITDVTGLVQGTQVALKIFIGGR